MSNFEITNNELNVTANIAVRSDFRRGLTESLPIMLSFIPIALFFGGQAAQKQLSAIEVMLMTGLNFAGGSELAALGVWTSPPQVFLIVAITFLVNSRHLLMGAALTPYIRHLSKRQAFAALFFMTDESWALGLADAQRRKSVGVFPNFSLTYYMGASFGLYLSWVGFSTVGAAFGSAIGNVEAYGFDMAFPAVFLVLLRGMWKSFRAARPWMVSLTIAALVYLFIPGAWYVIAGTSAGIATAFIWGENKND